MSLRHKASFGLLIILLPVIFWTGVRGEYNADTKRMVPRKVSRRVIVAPSDTGGTDLPMPHDQDSPVPQENGSGISLGFPENIQYEVEYDPLTGNYNIVQTVGGLFDYRRGTSMSLDEFLQYDMNENLSEFWTEKQEEEADQDRAWAPKLNVGGDAFKNIFGSNEIEIRPQGSAELTFGVNVSKQDNPRIPERQRTISTFDFNQRIQLNVVGKIGTKLQLNTNYNTEAAFDFENQMKLEYTGEEDEIIKKIEAGNVSLPLKGTLIPGSQSLFGLKVETQFGRLRNTTVFSQAKGERKDIEVAGGAQTQTFMITADNYEANRHYFLSQYFHDTYDQSMSSLPVVNSGVNITRIEVWVVNNQANTQDVRNIIAFTDLGEHVSYITPDLPEGLLTDNPETVVIPQRYPDNRENDIFQDMVSNDQVIGFTNANQAISQMGMGYLQGIHYERVGNARKLSPSEYTYNSRLGFISLRQALNNAEVLAVAYEYTLNGETYQVGTISQDGIAAPNALILKMLKSSITQVMATDGTTAPLWKLMMKNVYNIGAFQVSKENFRLDVWYNNPATGIDMNYIPRPPLEGRMLLQVLNMDKLDYNNQTYPDGMFDFVDNAATQGGLIESQNGRIYLPVTEPFGGHLAGVIRDGLGDTPEANALIDQVVFQPLYDSTKTAAQQIPALNRFKLKGQYQSASGAEISLNSINVPQGSVSVTAGGVKLIENQDYTVDYNLGRVRIINEGILNAGTPIRISLESNSLFNIQTKTMMGSRFDYAVSDKFGLGATVLNLRERPLTQKVNIGNEPVNNTILGTDLNYRTESDFITRMIDAIPFLETKQKSSVDFAAEFAYLIPGHSRAVGKDGNAYLDDFEGSQSVIDLRSINQWFQASTPKLQPDLFPEAQYEDSLIYNYNKAKISWYTIDPLFFRDGAPSGIDADVRSDHRMREVLESEVFPNRQLPTGTPPNTPTLDLSYYPSERGMYNYDLPNGTTASAGLNPDGTLADPASRWGGVQRALTTTDFETTNVEFIQFWLMDPFNEDSDNINGGDLYFNLGNVSEDVLNDSHLTFENGFPSQNQALEVAESNWGFYPTSFNVVNAFDATSDNYSQQDIGLDGLNSTAEANFFSGYLGELLGFLDPAAYSEYTSDLSADDYEYFRRDGTFNTLERYKNYNGNEGNSNTESINGISTAATTVPNTEDINQDLTLGTIESYYQYKVSLRPGDLGPGSVGTNYISDRFDQVVTTVNGDTRNVVWYQFKVPIRDFERKVGGITDFRSIRFIRVFMKGFSEPVTLRFARLELVRSEWRKYLESLETPGEIEPGDPDETTFNTAAVNIEENGNREPIPYVIPPGIERQVDVGTANLRNLNEQSLQLEVCNLADGDARAAYRNVNFDMRMYEKLKMFVHAEAISQINPLNSKDVTVFIRLGSDFDNNYYEYEVPLIVTPFGTSDPELIWPEANNVEIEFKKLQNLKTERPTGFSILQEYVKMDGNNRLKIKGNPNLANVVTVMVGVRNPAQDENPFAADDGLSKCAIVWVNELRLTDFNEQGGWASIARMNAQLADFGNLSVAANISTPGFGTLEQRVQERQQETIKGVDANTTLQLGKFFPEDAGVTLPMYLGYSETISNPRFDPLAPDIEFNDVTSSLSRADKRDRLKRTQDYTRRKSINFSNVSINPKKGGGKPDAKLPPKEGAKPEGKEGKEEGGKGKDGKKEDKPHFYDISNFSLSYAYNEIYRRDVNTEFNTTKDYTGGINYTFNNKPKEIKPFANIGFVKDSKALKFIKDFNFYPGIKQLSLRTQMDRTYQTMRIRDNSQELFGVDADVIIPTQVMKTWNWTRQYTFKYDLTKNLRLGLDANNVAFVGEPSGVIDKTDTDAYQAYKDTVLANIRNFGETTGYSHNATANYKLPFDKFPVIDFISSDASYSATYRWDRAPFSQDTLGNTIQNSRNLQLSAQANFLNLYNKVPLLKEINNKNKGGKNDNKKPTNDKLDGFGKEEEKDKKEKIQINPFHEFLRLLMAVQNVSGTYSKTEGILLPGYGRNTQMLGMDPNFEAPGVGFILGQQNTDVFGNPVGNFALEAGSNGWLVQQSFLNNQYTETFNETINFRAKIEPIRYLTIDLTANQTETRSLASFFRWDEEDLQYVFDSPMETGSYSASIITWPTTFTKDREDFSSETFDAFLNDRRFISARLNDEYHNFGIDSLRPNGFYAGWGPTAQDVVIPTFISSYTGTDINDVALNPFDTKMRPNWKITYDGLAKIPSIKKRFKQFAINHNYRSTFTTNYVTNLSYEEDGNGNPTQYDQSEYRNYVVQRQINSVSISEQLSPLVGFDMTLKVKNKNQKDIDPQIRIEWSKDRTATLGLSNFQITESKNNSLIFGVGYTIPEVPNPFINRRRGSKLSKQMLENSPLNIRADVTIRDNVTIIRKMVERQNQVTAGQRIISIKTSADLSVSDKLTVRFFYDHQLTRPKISTSFPTANINSGLSLRFQLTQ